MDKGIETRELPIKGIPKPLINYSLFSFVLVFGDIIGFIIIMY
tara:strand:- start:73 stop:201 length:129 start_codon:yes stop_codon:yes gene_type:complete